MKYNVFIKVAGMCALTLGVVPALSAGAQDKKIDSETCETVWNELCGNIGNVYKTDAFKYVSPAKKRPNVFIYGDSISIKYSSQVRAELEGKANVFRLFTNGGSSHDFISKMNAMEEAMFQPGLERGWNFKWDVIHFNVGLHDLKYLKGRHLNTAGKQVSSVEVYKTNLDEICRYLKINYPEAKLIFATTTPVPAHAKGRLKGDSLTFNKAALEVLANYPDIVINDLYAFTFPHAEEWAEGPGNVHYNEPGFTAQGKEVARIIAGNL